MTMNASSFAPSAQPAIGARGRQSGVSWLGILVLVCLIAAAWGASAAIGWPNRPEMAWPLTDAANGVTARELAAGVGPASRTAAEEVERAGYSPDLLQFTSGHTQLRAVWAPATEPAARAGPVAGSADGLPLPPVTE
jgi:hypothetical protein